MLVNLGQPTIVGIGEILWDLLPDEKRLGGAPSNFAYHAKVLGAHAVIVSAVGNDELGLEALESLDRLEIDRTGVAIDPSHATGTASVELTGNGIPSYRIAENCAWDFIEWQPRLSRMAADADAVCFGSLSQRSAASRDTIRRFIRSTTPSCKRIFDINLRQEFYTRDCVEESLKLANVLKLNDEELAMLTDTLSLSGSATRCMDEILRRYSLELVALTRGAHGSVIVTSGQTVECPGFPTQVEDTVGAGDAFTAALVTGLLAGRELREINAHACRIAALACSHKGAMPQHPSETVDKLQFRQ